MAIFYLAKRLFILFFCKNIVLLTYSLNISSCIKWCAKQIEFDSTFKSHSYYFESSPLLELLKLLQLLFVINLSQKRSLAPTHKETQFTAQFSPYFSSFIPVQLFFFNQKYSFHLLSNTETTSKTFNIQHRYTV